MGGLIENVKKHIHQELFLSDNPNEIVPSWPMEEKSGILIDTRLVAVVLM